jgi:hypothetical protein
MAFYKKNSKVISFLKKKSKVRTKLSCGMHLGLEIADGSRTKLRYHMPEAAGLQK